MYMYEQHVLKVLIGPKVRSKGVLENYKTYQDLSVLNINTFQFQVVQLSIEMQILACTGLCKAFVFLMSLKPEGPY